jgi:hypothetical protein
MHISLCRSQTFLDNEGGRIYLNTIRFIGFHRVPGSPTVLSDFYQRVSQTNL